VTTVVVAGALAAKPGNGGNASTRLSWAASFAALGFEVWLVERLAPGPPDRAALAWARAVVDRHGFGGRTAFLSPGGGTPEEVKEALSSALLLDIGGHLGTTGAAADAKVKVFLDDDPGFTQVWETSAGGGSRLADHDLHLTYGANIGRPGCPLPTAGRRWHAILPPVHLADWDGPGGPAGPRFTTVATWRSPYGALVHEGVDYGLKHHEFRAVLPLPAMVDAEFEVALDIDPADHRDREALEGHGWRLVDPRSVAGDVDAYRAYVRSSGAEFSPAQGVYVHGRTGWVSDRTACYLASGRPALVQDTGASSVLPLGEGLLTYRTLEEAAAQAARLLDDLDGHGRAARRLAEEHFDGRRIAASVCELAGVAP
jgi:hypothetical protein